MSETKELYVGQVLYDQSLKEYVIEKVAKKYFYIRDDRRNHGYGINTLKYQDKVYTQFSIQLFLTKQELLDKKEKETLNEKISKSFNYRNSSFSLEQLRQVDKILFLTNG